jgi:hypothetical protein
MNKTLLVGFLIAIATQSLGQGIVVQNSNPTTSIANRGSYIADSIFRIGTRDTVKPSWWNPAWSFNGALQIGLDGKPYYYYGGYWRGVGSGASVTSITQGYGMTLSPNPIVSTGSVRVDTTAISTKANVNSLLSAKLNISDTSSMLGGYLRKADTASLSNRINLKLNIADTNSMLGGYLRKVDTLTLSNRIDARVKYTDTASMLAPYLPSAAAAAAYVPYTGATTNVNLGTHTISSYNSVVNHTSGSGVAASITKGGSGEALTVVKSSGSGNAASITGGVTLLSELHLNTDLADAYIASAANWNAKIGAGDTSAMLSSYLRKADTASLSTRIDARVKYSDTSAMLGGYLRKVDTASLSNRIDAAGNDWKLTGNSGTNASTNFIGTTDGVDVMFRRGNVRAGFLNSSLNNTSFGVTSMPTNVTGAQNAAYGSNSLPVLTSGSSNSSYGYFSLYNNTTGANNSAFGNNSLASNVSSNSNSAFGFQALNSVTGAQNTGVGYRAGLSSTIGNNNVSVGFDATAATTGGDNTALGSYASAATTGSQNIAVGRSSNSGTTGSKNLVLAYSGSLPTATASNQMNIGNVIWGLDCSGTTTTAAGRIGIGTNAPNASSILDLTSTTQGLGLPSMTTTQQNAIATPRTGLEIYNSTLTTPQFYNGSVWTGAWYKRGNSGTDAANDFIGTSDNVDLVFRRNNVTSGRLNTALNATSFGVGSLPTTATGDGNTGIGRLSLGSLSSGTRNTALGVSSSNITTGSENVGIGWGALSGISTSSFNTSVGSQSAGLARTNQHNSYFGYGAGYAHLAGDNSVYIGSEAGFRSSGGENVAIGKLAGGTNTNQVSGDSNVFVGSRAGSDFRMVAASKNVLIGYDAQTATFAGSNQLNLANVLWGSGCTGVKNNPAGSLSIGANAPNASAIFDIVSTTRGLGLPSMTTTQQNAIGTPRAGLAVYNSTLAAPTYYNGTAWSTFGGASGWGLTGNAGTSAATNFIGTTDDIDLMFRRNNISSGRISANNTAFGNGAGAALSGGGNNALFGAGAGGKLTNPSQNTYFGFNAGSEVVSGFNNIYIGAQAASSTGHTSGNKNLVISHQGMVATNNGANQLNIGNVLWGVDCSATGTTSAGRLGIGTNAPNASALLDLTSTTQGLLLPRMTTAQINAIGSPAAGLTVYNTDLLLICFYNGTAWQKVTATTM